MNTIKILGPTKTVDRSPIGEVEHVEAISGNIVSALKRASKWGKQGKVAQANMDIKTAKKFAKFVLALPLLKVD